MESVIHVINKLQDVFQTVENSNIQLPQIAVVGTQSAGKSSVIEAIFGSSFLPRGTGIVTRRPLVLQFLRCPLNDKKYRLEEKGTMWLEQWGEFLHKEGEIFSDFEDICKEIELDTDRVAGNNKGICDEPIRLKIYSSRTVNLTLVDLPGLTKVPVGDQPPDIEDQIKKLIMKYIKNENCIILAVTAANVDIATSEALKFAKEVDPNGKRTLAVLTKLDLMDSGTDAVDALCGRILPVQLGIIGVVNRSQKDINEKKTIEEQLDKEVAFLKEKYSAYADRNGTAYLAKTLSSLLVNHIRDRLPDLNKRVKIMISKYQERLTSYGDTVIDTDYTLFRIITKFESVYRSTLSGTTRNAKSTGNTLLYHIIHEQFEKTLNEIQPTVDKAEATRYFIENAAGPRPNLFDIPSFDVPFEKLVKQHMEKLKEPSLELINRVRKEMLRNIEHYDPQLERELKRFPKLKSKIFDVVSKLVSSRMKVTRERVEDLIDSEIAYINKKHPDFQREKAITPLVNYKEVYYGSHQRVNVQSLTGSLLSGTKGDKENCEVLENLVKLYFEIVRKTVLDAVPKAIMFSLVNFVTAHVESALVANVKEQQGAELLLDEANNVSEEREKAIAMLTALERANQIIDEVYEGGDYIVID